MFSCMPRIATDVTVSFVWLLSISAISVWNLWSRGDRSLSAKLSHPMVSTGARFSLRISLVKVYISSQFAGGSILTLPSLPVIFFAGARRAFLGLLSFFGDAIVAIDISLLSCFTVAGASCTLLRFFAGLASPSELDSAGIELNSESDEPSFFKVLPFACAVMFATDRV
jgi:hypothetical protein